MSELGNKYGGGDGSPAFNEHDQPEQVEGETGLERYAIHGERVEGELCPKCKAAGIPCACQLEQVEGERPRIPGEGKPYAMVEPGEAATYQPEQVEGERWREAIDSLRSGYGAELKTADAIADQLETRIEALTAERDHFAKQYVNLESEHANECVSPQWYKDALARIEALTAALRKIDELLDGDVKQRYANDARRIARDALSPDQAQDK